MSHQCQSTESILASQSDGSNDRVAVEFFGFTWMVLLTFKYLDLDKSVFRVCMYKSKPILNADVGLGMLTNCRKY